MNDRRTITIGTVGCLVALAITSLALGGAIGLVIAAARWVGGLE